MRASPCKKRIYAADLFCGAGGTSTGLQRAAEQLGATVDLVAVNHWNIAIATHSANHPYAEHVCSSLDGVDPRRVVPGGHLDLLVASPECTHHSVARGGRPVHDQSRASGWHLLRWAELLKIDNILIENVPEYRTWGPIGSDGHPLRSRRGETYQAFLNALRSLGYKVEDRILNAADYGDPTTRERLFIIARRGHRPMVWPEPTHSRDGEETLLGRIKKWRAAKEIIDWNLKGQSIFNRKKPLSDNTMKRILAGLRKFGGQSFIMANRNNNSPRSIDDPLATLCTGNHMAYCEPFIVPQHSGGAPRSVERPVPTITTTDRGIRLVQPFLVQVGHGERKGQAARIHDVRKPLPTVTTKNGFALAEAFLVHMRGTNNNQIDGSAKSVDSPLPTLTAGGGHLGLVEPFIIQTDQTGSNGSCTRSTKRPLPTLVTKQNLGLVEAFLVKYNGTGGAMSIDLPLHSVTTKDRFGLVKIEGQKYAIDIRFRMLQPHELARAMSFPDDYKFSGTKSDTVKQIGNAVPVQLAKALCMSLLNSATASSRIVIRTRAVKAA